MQRRRVMNRLHREAGYLFWEERVDQRLGFVTAMQTVWKGILQLVQAAIAQQRLQEGQAREGHATLVARLRQPGIDGCQSPLLEDQPQPIAVEADLQFA